MQAGLDVNPSNRRLGTAALPDAREDGCVINGIEVTRRGPTMNTPILSALLPLIILALTAIVVMLAIAFLSPAPAHRRAHATRSAVVAGLHRRLRAHHRLRYAEAVLPVVTPHGVSSLLVVDPFALLYTMVLLIAGVVVVLFSMNYLARHAGLPEEFYLLLLLALLGATTLAFSSHLASFFLALELLSVSLYAMLAYVRGNPLNIEAGIKYLILSSVSSAFLLFGMALLYAQVGVMTFAGIAARTAGNNLSDPLTLVGLGLIIAGSASS